MPLSCPHPKPDHGGEGQTQAGGGKWGDRLGLSEPFVPQDEVGAPGVVVGVSVDGRDVWAEGESGGGLHFTARPGSHGLGVAPEN